MTANIGQRLQTMFGRTDSLQGTVTYDGGPYKFTFDRKHSLFLAERIAIAATPNQLAFQNYGLDQESTTLFDPFSAVFEEFHPRDAQETHEPENAYLFLHSQVTADIDEPSIVIHSGFHVRETRLVRGDLKLTLDHITGKEVRRIESEVLEGMRLYCAGAPEES